jgi:hypothetical protein
MLQREQNKKEKVIKIEFEILFIIVLGVGF